MNSKLSFPSHLLSSSCESMLILLIQSLSKMHTPLLKNIDSIPNLEEKEYQILCNDALDLLDQMKKQFRNHHLIMLFSLFRSFDIMYFKIIDCESGTSKRLWSALLLTRQELKTFIDRIYEDIEPTFLDDF